MARNEAGQILKGLYQGNIYLMLNGLDFVLWGEPLKGFGAEAWLNQG